jgi:dynein heavy chain 2
MLSDENGPHLFQVSYNKRLVGLNNEVRVLAGQGYNIPHKIMVTSELARKFSKQARDLERIASFHNTIGDRMITSQRPLMLDAAVSLAQLVKEQTDMTWNNTDRVQRYIEKLQQHVDQLARQNNKLASYHKTIAEKVVELMDIDLLKQQNKWKDGLKDIRQIMSQVEQQGFTNLKSWRSHWDHQLYKALEHQYQVGLEALNEYLPEIEVFLTYRQQQLQFQPPIEEIRMKYYSQLKRFLAIPKNFKGVSESSENLIFPTIIDRNAHRYSHLFKKAEELFMLLEKKKDSFNDWVALGSVDIEDFIQENFKQPEDWDQNFSASKARGQDIGRLPSGKEKLQCISINYAPLRTEIELLNRKYWDILVVTLQRSIINDIESIEKFTSEATDNLRRQPQTVEEIGEANLLHKTYQQKSPEMMGIFENADRKNKILSKWTKEQVEHVHRIGDVWDNFSSLMDNHEDLISRQVDAIKGTLNTDVNNLNNEIEKFKLRWDATKPKEENLEGNSGNVVASIKLIKEKRREWDELLERREKIKSDHSHFGLDDPDFPQVDQVDEDLAKIEDTWGLFDEFNTSLKDMSKEEWIIFRSKSFRFEEFLGQWYDKLHNSPNKSSITVKLLQEIEQYKGVLPVLKYVRGEIFSDQHWNEMYGMLGMPRKNLTELKFEDFLNVRQKLVATAQELQELNNRAAGEVVIRQALSELDVWEVDAKFTFTEHQASTGEQIPLIKDWKDVINKVLGSIEYAGPGCFIILLVMISGGRQSSLITVH